MPYINQTDRVKFDYALDTIVALLKRNPNYEGDLNYCLSHLVNLLQYEGD